MRMSVVIYSDEYTGLSSTYIYGTVLLKEDTYYDMYQAQEATEMFVKKTFIYADAISARAGTVSFDMLKSDGSLDYVGKLKYKTVETLEME